MADLFSKPVAPRPLSEAERLDWLRLARSDNVGPRTFHDLIGLYGSAAAALAALPGLARRGGRDIRIAAHGEAEREIARAERHGVRLVALGEPDYPALLAEIAGPPPIIGLRGSAKVLGRPVVGIVGSRNASIPGLKMAAQLARDLGSAGYAVVSGLARGIDAAAHQASLATGTIAVLAGGHDRIYPPENEPLLERIVETGLAVTEMPMGHEPRAKDFPRRNRLIAGLALGVVVVEAAERSGSLITARLALEENREVFAVPGSPADPRAAGTNRLLKQGAALVTEAADVDNVLRSFAGRLMPAVRAEEAARPLPAVQPAEGERDRILSLLGPVPVAVDEVARLSGLAVGTVRVILLELELAGRLHRDTGGRVLMA